MVTYRSRLKDLLTRGPVLGPLVEECRRSGLRPLMQRARVAARLLPPPQAPAVPPHVPLPAASRTAPEVAQFTRTALDAMATRNLNLLNALLARLWEMQQHEDDAERLSRVYEVDHLAVRLRGLAERWRVLAGAETVGVSEHAMLLYDVLRDGQSNVEDYTRIEIGDVVSVELVDFAAQDLARLVSELMDNAVRYSLPYHPVSVTARTEPGRGVLIRIEDRGIGMTDQQLSQANRTLTSAPVVDEHTLQHSGLSVVRCLAIKHGVDVTLVRRGSHGIVARVWVPEGLTRALSQTDWSHPDTVTSAPVVPLPPRLRALSVPSAPRREGDGVSGMGEGSMEESRSGRLDVGTSSGRTASGLPIRQPRSVAWQMPGDPTTPAPNDAEARKSRPASLAHEFDAFNTGMQTGGRNAPDADSTSAEGVMRG